MLYNNITRFFWEVNEKQNSTLTCDIMPTALRLEKCLVSITKGNFFDEWGVTLISGRK